MGNSPIQYAYVNGDIVPVEEAKVSIFDRGFLFADGVYEVSGIIDGKMLDNDMHLKRLERSLAELELTSPLTLSGIEDAQKRLIEANGVTEGMIYLQLTRGGKPPRQFNYPDDLTPTLVMFTQSANLLNNPAAASGIKAITVPEIRWKRRDIKSVALLAQAMCKQMAAVAGATEALMVEDDYVTEGTSSSAFIVKGNRIISREANTEILNGITRQALLKLLDQTELEFEQRRFSVDEAYAADEVFVTSASTFVLPIVDLDGNTIGNGSPGPVAARLRDLYIQSAKSA